ncbi:MAG: spore coat protein CotJB [Oscillospiraceae bacterium]|nr:spore coat protein CotJB [Oscillospiraceae bacterium]
MDEKKEPMNDNGTEECTWRFGELPACAPLSVPYVPVQKDADPRYNPADALSRGTLFPGLELPFKNTVNRTNPYAGTPLGEVMALRFMVNELQLYLDTHKDDAAAFKLMKDTIKLSKEANRRFTARFGPLSVYDLEDMDSYAWIDGPWPWEFNQRGATD